MNRNFLMAAAKARTPVLLTNGQTVTLVGIPKRAGQRCRIQYADGNTRTIPLSQIAELSTQPERTP